MDAQDHYLAAEIQEALARDPRLAELHLDVAVVAGAVHITGEVATEERRAAVLDLVRERFGDRDIHCHVTVTPTEGPQAPEAIG
jgi:osmotically-inducible protein OsmY